MNTNLVELKHFNDDLDARICYEEFSGECYRYVGDVGETELVVIINPGDDSGAIIEDGEGKEHCVHPSKLYVGPVIFQKIRDIRLSYNQED